MSGTLSCSRHGRRYLQQDPQGKTWCGGAVYDRYLWPDPHPDEPIEACQLLGQEPVQAVLVEDLVQEDRRRPAPVQEIERPVRFEIRRRRSELGLKQVELARRAHCTGQTVSNVERGYMKPSADLVRRLLAALDGAEPDKMVRRWIDVSLEIIARRKALRIPQRALARACQLTQGYLAQLESGDRRIPLATGERILAALELLERAKAEDPRLLTIALVSPHGSRKTGTGR